MAEQEPNRRGLPGSEKLAHLDCFDPKAFQSDDAGEQEVCDFVLMLAVVYNDFKDLLWAIDRLKKCDPLDGEINPSNGELAGMRGHVTRQFHSLVFEFAKLLRTQELVLKHPLFLKTMTFVSPEAREKWGQLILFSNEKDLPKGEKDLYRISMLLRQNIGSHYFQPKFLSKGYRHFFNTEQADQTHANAFISRGATLEASRYYFADAAIDGCIPGIIGGADMSEIRQSLNSVADSINRTLYEIVPRFIQARNFAWTRYLSRKK